MDLFNNTRRTEQVLLENYDKYYRLALSYTRNEEDALDVVQESAYRAIKDCGKVKHSAYLSTWIYKIVMNVSLDMLRRKKHESLPGDLPEPAFEENYSELDLKEMLNSLDEKSRTIVLLRYFEDLKLNDIAQIMDESVNTVKARLYRALKKLRLNLEAERYSGGPERV